MSRLALLKRRTIVFAALIVVLSGFLVFRPAETSTQSNEALPNLVPGFSSENAASIDLRQGGSLMTAGQERLVKLALRRERDGSARWVVASAFDYPANDTYVSRLLSEIAKARLVGESTRREETFADYAQPDGWIEITVRDAAGKELAAVGVGKSSWKTGETNVLLRQDGQRVVRVRNLSGDSAKVQPEAWFEARMFPGLERDDVEAFEVHQKVEIDGKVTTRRLAFTRRPQEAAKPPEPGEPPGPPPERGWDMTSPEQGPASNADVDDLVHALTGLLFEDVIDRPKDAEAGAQHGFDAPEIVATATFAPARPGETAPRATLTVGKLDTVKKLWTAKRAGAPWVFSLKDDERGVGRFRSDPSKFKPAPKPVAPPPAPGELGGSPDGPGDGQPPKEPAPAPAPGAPGEPKPPEEKPGEPAPGEPPKSPKPPEEPKPPEPAPPAPPEKPDAPK